MITIGTYWRADIDVLARASANLILYSFGDVLTPDSNTKNHYTFIGSTADKPLSPLQFAINHCRQDNPDTDFLDMFVNRDQPLINCVTDRSLGFNVMDTQGFFTGFYNYFNGDNDFVENFLKLYKGTGGITFDDI